MADETSASDSEARGNKPLAALIVLLLFGAAGYGVWQSQNAPVEAEGAAAEPAEPEVEAAEADAGSEELTAESTQASTEVEATEPVAEDAVADATVEPEASSEAAEAVATVVEESEVASDDSSTDVVAESGETVSADATQDAVEPVTEVESAETDTAPDPASDETDVVVEDAVEAAPETESAEVTESENIEVAAVENETNERPLENLRPPETIDQTAPNAPRFDIVRIDETGSGLVAGRAEPGSIVRVLSGDTELATAEVQASGEFVAFIQTPDSDEGQALSLVALSGAQESVSGEEILVLPVEATDETPVAPAIVAQDDTGVRIVQPSGLGKVNGVTLDSISYDETGAVRLSGRAPGPLPIRIYVSGNSAGAANAAEDGTWSTRIEGIEEGRYVLRVDALNADGSVSSRAESPFQRVFPTAEQRANPTEVTVQPGNTLWVMARDRYGEGILYTQIFAANQEAIRDPDLIYPGQIFTLPEEKDFTQ